MAHNYLIPYDEVDLAQCTTAVGFCREAACSVGGDNNENYDDHVGFASTVEEDGSDCRRCDWDELLAVRTEEVLNTSEH